MSLFVRDVTRISSKILCVISLILLGAGFYSLQTGIMAIFISVFSVGLFLASRELEANHLENRRRFECDSPNLHVIHKIDHITQSFPHTKELQEMLAFRREFGFMFRIEGKVQIDSGSVWQGYLYFKYDSTTDMVLARMVSYAPIDLFTDWVVMSPRKMRALFIAYYAKLGIVSTKSNSVVNLPGLDMAHNELVYKTGEGAKYHILITKDRVPPPSAVVHIALDSPDYVLSYQDNSGNTGYIILPLRNYDAVDCVARYLSKRSE